MHCCTLEALSSFTNGEWEWRRSQIGMSWVMITNCISVKSLDHYLGVVTAIYYCLVCWLGFVDVVGVQADGYHVNNWCRASVPQFAEANRRWRCWTEKSESYWQVIRYTDGAQVLSSFFCILTSASDTKLAFRYGKRVYEWFTQSGCTTPLYVYGKWMLLQPFQVLFQLQWINFRIVHGQLWFVGYLIYWFIKLENYSILNPSGFWKNNLLLDRCIFSNQVVI